MVSAGISRGATRRSDTALETKNLEGEKQKTGAFELVASRPLQHPALLQYLTKRGIDHDIARAYLSEIDFKAPHSAGKHFSLGHPSGDDFEARNALFKGFLEIGETVTFHDMPTATRLQAFEGFMDFLSYLSQDKPT
jgi:hypothetical protein